MGICPYCNAEVHLADFFVKDLGKKISRKRLFKKQFVGEGEMSLSGHGLRMYTCPHCNKILGFSEYYR